MRPREAELVLAASPREWALRLHRHVADHGGARVRATVLHAPDALSEAADVFVCDDTTSFLSARLVDSLHERGRWVLGVFDPDDPRGKGELLDVGADEVLPRTASAEQFVAAVTALVGRGRPISDAQLAAVVGEALPSLSAVDGEAAGAGGLHDRTGSAVTGGLHAGAGVDAPAGERPRGRLIVVAAASAGAGATEVSVALAAALAGRSNPVALVDADDLAPSVAQRLRLGLYPNLRAAVDLVERRNPVRGALVSAEDQPPGMWVLPGLPLPRGWSDVRPTEVLGVVEALRAGHTEVVVNAGPRLEDVPTAFGPARHGIARALVGAADILLAVTLPTPIGVVRLLDWVAEARAVAPAVPVHVVCNRTRDGDAFRRDQVTAEIAAVLPPAGVHFLPADARVEAAAWAGTRCAAGPFTRAVAGLAGALGGASAGARRGGGARRRFLRSDA